MELIISGSLKIPWIAGTREKSLTKLALQKCNLESVIQELKQRKLSLKFLGILIYGVCKIVKKLTEMVHEEISKILKSCEQTPAKIRNSDISAKSEFHQVRSSLKYSGAKLSVLLNTPPSLEKVRRGFQSRIEDITLTEYQVNAEVQRESFGVEELFDVTLYQDSFPLSLNFDNPILESPKLSPHLPRLDETHSKPKKNKIEHATVYKGKANNITREMKQSAQKKQSQCIIFPEKMEELLKYFAEIKEITPLKIVIEEDKIEPVINSSAKQSVKEDYIQITPANYSTQLEKEIDEYISPARIIVEKNTQIVKIENDLFESLKANKTCYFHSLLINKGRMEVSRAMMSILVLVYSSEINLQQKRFFGRIKISKL